MEEDDLLRAENSFLLAIDLQEKLAPAMADLESTLTAVKALLAGANGMRVPIAMTEHCASSIGATLPELREEAAGAKVLPKRFFCVAKEKNCLDYLRSLERRQAVICGTEAHVCVLQSALGLKAAGFDVYLVTDAVTSRDPRDRYGAIERMAAEGIRRVTTEMVLFEWIERGDSAYFKKLLPVIKALKKT